MFYVLEEDLVHLTGAANKMDWNIKPTLASRKKVQWSKSLVIVTEVKVIWPGVNFSLKEGQIENVQRPEE